MEELTKNNHQLGIKQTMQVQNMPAALKIYSSRFIQIGPQKVDDTVTLNEPYLSQLKQNIRVEYEQLNDYMNSLDHVLTKVNDNQIDWLGQKYRYYLIKFKKYSNQHERLLAIYNDIDRIVLQSPQVQEEIKSINFIKMISLQTHTKLEALKKTVKQAEEKKQQNQIQIKQLRNQLNIIKNQFFHKKRLEASVLQQIESHKKQNKMEEIQRTMLKIRQDKKFQLQQLPKSPSLKQNKSFLNQNSLNYLFRQNKKQKQNIFKKDSTIKELQNINIETEKYLKKLSQQNEDFKMKKMQQKRMLKTQMVQLMDLQSVRIKSRETTRKIQRKKQLLTNQKIIQQIQMTNKLKEEFDKKTPQQIMSLIINSNKIRELFQIIQEERVKQAKQRLLQKRKINLERSQMYKQNTDMIFIKGEDLKQNQFN